jgi:hypothetical protein
MIEMLFFGDIFTYRDKLYVYLDMDEDTVYAARVLSAREAKPFVSMREDSIKQRGEKETRQLPAFCFVQLVTEHIDSGSVAHLANTQTQKEPNRFLHGDGERLCKADLLELRKEILEGPVPRTLKLSVEKLDLDSLPD